MEEIAQDQYITESDDIRRYAFEALPERTLESEKGNILVFFTDKTRKIIAKAYYADTPVEKIDAQTMARTVLREGDSEIFIAYKAPHYTDKEWELVRHQHNTNHVYARLQNEEEVNAFVKLARDLKEYDVTLGDVMVYGTDSYFLYSKNISATLFPSFGIELDTYAENIGRQFSGKNNKDALFKEIRDHKWRHKGKSVVENMHAIFLDNKNIVLSQHEVPMDNMKLIPGLIDERKPVFDPIFKQAIKDNTESIVLIRKYNGNDYVEGPTKEDIAILHEARKQSKKYNVPLNDYIILGDYDDKNNKFHTVSFVETYGMK